MNKTPPEPSVYDPDMSFHQKGAIVRQLCIAMAAYRGISSRAIRTELINSLHVDIDNLSRNPVGIFLLYEYLFARRPAACRK